MKKILISILLIFSFMTLVNAEECNVISGSGKDIGDEIACGTEHFYVTNYSKNETQMLSKYNLYLGYTYYKKTSDSDTICDGKFMSVNDTCYEVVGTPIKIDGTTGPDVFAKIGSLDVYYDASNIALQNELAIGAHGGSEGEPEFPEVGIIVFSLYPSGVTKDGYTSNSYYDNENIYDISYTIPGYKDTFESMGITVKSVKMPTFEDISKIIEKVSNKKFDLSEYEDTGEYVIGSIKDLIPKKYSWIYSTTYWVSTIYDKYPQDNGDQSDVAFFIDTLGNVCNADECEIMVGAGIRPLVTIENKNIIYPFRIESKTDGNGSIEVIDMAYADDLITFKVSPKKGYKLYSLKLTDSTGKSVSYKEDEIINNSDGTVSVNSFTMPSNDVTIEATFKSTVKNPKTGVTTPIIGLIIVLFVSVIVLVILDKRRMRIN